MRINSIVASSAVALASSSPAVSVAAKVGNASSAFSPNKREALENRLNRQQEEVKKLKKEMEAANDRSGFDDFMAGLFGSDRGAGAAEKQNSTANATSAAAGAAAGVAATIPPVGTAIGAAISQATAAIASARERQEAKENYGGFGNLPGIFLGPLVGTAIGQAIGGAANDGDERASKGVFEVPKHYTGIQLQEGRVALDADWNESESRKTRKKKP